MYLHDYLSIQSCFGSLIATYVDTKLYSNQFFLYHLRDHLCIQMIEQSIVDVPAYTMWHTVCGMDVDAVLIFHD